MKPTKFNSPTLKWRVVLPVKWSADGKRKTKYFETKDQAIAFCKEIKERGRAVLEGYQAPLPKTEKDQFETAIRWALSELGDFQQIYSAVEHYKLTKLNIRAATVREAIEAFQVFRATDVSPRTVNSDRGRLVKLLAFEALSDIQLSQVTRVQLLRFFDTISKKSLRSVYKTVHKFFGWAHDREYLGENVMDKIPRQGEYGVCNDYYPVPVFKRMLRVAAGLEPINPGEEPTREFINLLPWFVLSGFAGLRSSEAYQETSAADAIRWSDLYLHGVDKPLIDVRKEVAKGKKKRRPIDMEPALEAIRAWLPLCPEARDGFVVPLRGDALGKLKARFSVKTGIKFGKNALRNSFATYALSYSTLSGLGHVARQMGNSESVCERHYVQALPTGSGKAWFDLRPFEVLTSASVAV